MITAYTDGSCQKNPGKGGWAAIIENQYQMITIHGSEEETTNNRMEMVAAIKVLEALPEGSEVTIFSDSQYLIKGILCWLDKWIEEGRTYKNADLWYRLRSLTKVHKVHWQWVKGHAKNEKNNLVDLLAKQASGQEIKMKKKDLKIIEGSKEESNVVDFPIIQPAGYVPPEGDWLGNLPLNMCFYARQKADRGFRVTKFIKADQTPKGNVLLLMNEGGHAIPLDVSSQRYSNTWDLIEELGVIPNEEEDEHNRSD